MATSDNVAVELLVRAHLCPQKASGPAVAETEMRLLEKKSFSLMLRISQLPRCSPGLFSSDALQISEKGSGKSSLYLITSQSTEEL